MCGSSRDVTEGKMLDEGGHTPAAYYRLERRQIRRLMRDDGLVVVAAAGLVGATAGVLASVMVMLAETLHPWLLGLPSDGRLSTASELPVLRAILVLGAGGFVVGLATWLWNKRTHEIVDPIEANALYGGRMSLRDSTFVAGQSLLSSASGASLGIEGGFTQIAGAIGSGLGRILNRRRIDVRMLVGAGVAGGIAGAFDAPLAGAAYGFELIVGAYTVATLAPVVAAAVAGTMAANGIVGHAYRIPIAGLHGGSGIELWSLALGAVCGLVAIVLMRGVTLSERLVRESGLPVFVRPAAGGIVVGIGAMLVPHVLGSGHGAMAQVLQHGWPLTVLATVLMGKLFTSAVSLGTGFRGGLFSTSLFLGALCGAIAAGFGTMSGVVAAHETGMLSLVGMASFGAAVVGAPMTMALLAVEVSDNLSVLGPVLLGVVAATLTVRHIFGYSFATWRFHLRGEAILGGEDIGWVREAKARDLMQKDPVVVPAGLALETFRQRHRPGSAMVVIAVEGDGRFAGLVDLSLIYAARTLEEGDVACEDVGCAITSRDAWVAADTTIDRLLPLFDAHASEFLAVVEDAESKRVVGVLTEAYVLRRYRLEFDERQKEMFGL